AAPECLIAYKIYASCRERQAHYFADNVIEPLFRAHGLSCNMFWTGGAKYLLPEVSQRPFVERIQNDEEAQLPGWPALVIDAAEHWTAIANEWSLVRIPRFLDPSSAEYREWERFVSAQTELGERAEYERLKRKFEQ